MAIIGVQCLILQLGNALFQTVLFINVFIGVFVQYVNGKYMLLVVCCVFCCLPIISRAFLRDAMYVGWFVVVGMLYFVWSLSRVLLMTCVLNPLFRKRLLMLFFSIWYCVWVLHVMKERKKIEKGRLAFMCGGWAEWWLR